MNIRFNCDFDYDLRYELVRIVNGDLKKNNNLRTYILIIWGSLAFGAIPWLLGYRLMGIIAFLLVLAFCSFPFYRINKVLRVLKKRDSRAKDTFVTVTESEILITTHNGSEHCHPWGSFDSYYDGTLGCHLFLDKIDAVIIPISEIEKHFPSRAFMNFVKSKIPKAYKRVKNMR